MPNESDPRFLTHHALRIKGFAKAEVLAEIADLSVREVETHLRALAAEELAVFREARALWQLSPAGREAHRHALAADLAAVDIGALGPHYREFLELNDAFKSLCGDWQLRDGGPNDHTDHEYDLDVIQRLVDLNGLAQPLLTKMAGILGRLSPYAPRLDRTCLRVVEGDTHMFTGVMCGSYHDVWMELHEDLILSQGIDRTAEGSF